MTSAISNPILYGFMNENFREEFSKIWKKMKESSCCFKKLENSNNKSQESQEEEPKRKLTSKVQMETDGSQFTFTVLGLGGPKSGKIVKVVA